MTHAMASRSRGNGPSARLDGPRIAAGAGAIALNVVLLMLLMVPLRIVAPTPDTIRTEVDWLPTVPEKRVEPVPVPVPVEQPRTVPRPSATPTPRVEQPPSPQPVVEPMAGDLPAAPPVAVATRDVDVVASTTEVMAGAVLRYAAAPPPPYPRRALRAGVEGTVLLEVLVDIDGRPLTVDVIGSSGDRELDRAARRQVLEQWLFQPAVRDGRPVQAIGRVPVSFSLE